MLVLQILMIPCVVLFLVGAVFVTSSMDTLRPENQSQSVQSATRVGESNHAQMPNTAMSVTPAPIGELASLASPSATIGMTAADNQLDTLASSIEINPFLDNHMCIMSCDDVSNGWD
jgi:hypothetical protein